jgi:predicted adenylyl cyclase CyaB
MPILNIEIKARVNNPEVIEKKLLYLDAKFIGMDHQVDTYFNNASGRLKLREGNIENSLIFYRRIETKDLKKSEVLLQKLGPDNSGLKSILDKIHGTWKVVKKQRKIFFIENVKFHIDKVHGLGSFVEIEAIDDNGKLGEKLLSEQCKRYVQVLGIDPSDFIDKSYSDMI